jgi:hypothetical protein
MENIVQKSIGRIINLDEVEIAKHSRAGEADGVNENPSSEQRSLGKYEETLVLEAKAEWIKYLSMTEQYRTTLDQRAIQIKNQLRSEVMNESTNLSQSQRQELDLLDQQIGQSSVTYKHLQDEFLNSKEELQKIEQTVNRPLDISNKDFYLPLMVALAIAEVPVNRLAFELFFESMPAVSLLLSAAIGALFIYFAHVIGVMIKRLKCKEIDIDRNKIIISIALLGVVSFTLIYFLGVMREQLIAVEKAGTLDLESILSSTGPAASINPFDSIAIGSKGFTLLLLNLIILITGIVSSVFRHDPHPDYEKIYNKAKKIESKFLSYRKKFETEQVQKLREFNQRMEVNKSQQQNFESELQAISDKRDAIDSKIKNDKQNLYFAIARKIMAYQSGNRKTRKTSTPTYFSDDAVKSVERIMS